MFVSTLLLKSHHEPSPISLLRLLRFHELDKVGGKVGEGGQRSKVKVNAGRNGCVRIFRPGFYQDFHPNRNLKPYIGHPRRQEVLLPIGKPVNQVLDEAEAAAEARKNPPAVKEKKKEYR